MKKIYFIGIGGIGISALARYYNEFGFAVFGSDSTNSELIENLKNEGIGIEIGERENFIDESFSSIIYTEAISKSQKELQKAQKLKIKTLSYPEALAQIVNEKKLIAISGTHGKSTTTSLASIMLKNSEFDFSSIIGTLLKEFDGKNYFSRNTGKKDKYFVIEACEYKRSFLNYKPEILLILNMEVDHLDYYKDEKDYISAYLELIKNTKVGAYIIVSGEDKNIKNIDFSIFSEDKNFIFVYDKYFEMNGKKIFFPEINMQIPGKHILFDAKFIYTLGTILKISEKIILYSLEKYSGAWRRMEKVGQTKNGNIVISDYGHHPTEIKLTLEAIKNNYKNKNILTIFQPHQYNRTIELLDDFKNCFENTDKLIIPNIYESRDSLEDKAKMNSKIFVENINHKDKIDGKNFENTLKLIEKFDKENSGKTVIVLMGAGNVDNLRYKLI